MEAAISREDAKHGKLALAERLEQTFAAREAAQVDFRAFGDMALLARDLDSGVQSAQGIHQLSLLGLSACPHAPVRDWLHHLVGETSTLGHAADEIVVDVGHPRLDSSGLGRVEGLEAAHQIRVLAHLDAIDVRSRPAEQAA